MRDKAKRQNTGKFLIIFACTKDTTFDEPYYIYV